jgi:hypothetical protein
LREAVAAQGALIAAALAATPPDAPVRDGSSVAELDRSLGTDGLGAAPQLDLGPLPDRLLRLVVAGLDLPEPVAPDRGALRLVVKALAKRLAQSAPGRHVEARIPPYAAVQCVEGPRHTRGTPPNVVEANPVAFVELCTGRLTWAEAAADGRVRTWGDRADLSPYLPLKP